MSENGRSIDELIILKMMGVGFLDIRADAGKDIRSKKDYLKAYIISDLYHNIPGALAHGVNASDLLKQIYERAKRHDVESYVTKTEAWARRSDEKD